MFALTFIHMFCHFQPYSSRYETLFNDMYGVVNHMLKECNDKTIAMVRHNLGKWSLLNADTPNADKLVMRTKLTEH